MNVLNNLNADLMALVSAPGTNAKDPAKLDGKKENAALDFIKDKGLRNYLKHVEEEKIKALLEEARRRAMAKMGLDEEKLAQLENKMPDKAFAELSSQIAKLTQDIFEDLLKKNMANLALEKGEEPLSNEALAPRQSMTEKKVALFINHMA